MSDEVQLIPIEQIYVVNERHRDTKKFEIIVQNIKNVGLKVPIQVSRRPASETDAYKYDLICGQGRMEAFKALGHKEIPAEVKELTRQELLICSLVENIARRYATVGGGQYNTASGNAATVAGGYENTALGAYSFAAGNNAQAVNARAFVWSDGSATTTSTAGDQFMVRASGGVVIYSSSGNTAGVSLAAGSGTWSSLSDRNAKDGFVPVTPQQVLAKLAALPITQWSYKTEQGVRHVGPMAQDFYAAFGIGEDNKHITTVDEEGVALAAIQGLNQKMDERDQSLQQKLNEKDLEIQNLEKKLEELQAVVNQLAANK